MPSSSNYNYRISFGSPLTQMVKTLIILNCSIFVLQLVFEHIFKTNWILQYFALHPNSTPTTPFFPWQAITYAFLHGGFLHLFSNMLALWVFGPAIEEHQGRNNFLYLFLFCAVGGAILPVIVNFFSPQHSVVGASAGVFGIMVVYALLWPEREILFMFIFPIKMKYFVFLFMIPMTFMSAYGEKQDSIAHLSHLGGLLTGFGYWYLNRKYKFEFPNFFNWDDWMRRRKFKMYQEEMNARMNSRDRVDELLDKISKHGYNSLTAKEKKFLNEASSNYYNE